ncbi:MAG: TIGR02281 family clan AA aspartic protease [Rhizobiaceae bacterium]
MWRYLFGALIIGGLATEIPKILDRYEERAGQAANAPTQELNARNTTASPVSTSRPIPKVVTGHNPYLGKEARIKLGPRGQFIANARLNGYRSDVLVDTGASAVAINESTAYKMGIYLSQSDFKYTVQTANGPTKAAMTMIKEIEIGRVVVRDVRALVSRDTSLNVILLGMTFLNRLKKYEVNQGTLILTQ